MRKRISAIMAGVLLASSLFSQTAMAIELPDLGELASEAVSGISDAAKQAGETADQVKEKLKDAGVKVKVSAEQLGSATVEKASELTKQAGDSVDDAIEAVSEASDFVMDQAGHVVDLAASGADQVSSAGKEALEDLEKYGSLFMKLAQEAVSGMDLSKPESWDPAKNAVKDAIEKAYMLGLIRDEMISEESVGIVVDIVFEALMYGYQYSNAQITLGEFVSCLSRLLISKGLPVGAGYLISLLPFDIPFADILAKEAAYYLIAAAYGEDPADETEAGETVLPQETEN